MEWFRSGRCRKSVAAAGLRVAQPGIKATASHIKAA
jgi:hypothetical protein